MTSLYRLSSVVQSMISILGDEGGMSGPKIWPDAPTEAAARTTDAATAPWRNLLREIRGPFTRVGVGGWEAAGCAGAGGGGFVDVLGVFSSSDHPPLVRTSLRSGRPCAI